MITIRQAYEALQTAFGPKFESLDAEAGGFILADFCDMVEAEGGEDEAYPLAREYRKRIGKDGLTGYGEVQKVRAAAGWGEIHTLPCDCDPPDGRVCGHRIGHSV